MGGTSPRQGSFKREMGFMVPPPAAAQQMGFGEGGQGHGGRGANGFGTQSQHNQQGTNQQQPQQQQLYPHHESVLPLRASPKDTGGFDDDAFAPLWRGQEQGSKQTQNGQQQQGSIQQEQGGWSGRTRSGATFGAR